MKVSNPLQRHMQVMVQQGQVVSRRNFLRHASVVGMTASTLNMTDVLSASTESLRNRGMACILLWMQGGPSQFETFAPKPEHENGGETRAIGTRVGGIQIAENMPRCAQVMQDLAVLRSLTSREGNHQRATYLLHHGYLPMGGVDFPTLGAHVADRIGNAACQLPSYVRVGGRLANAGGGGFLGVDYDPLVLQSAQKPPANTKLATSAQRTTRRLQLLSSLQDDFAASAGAQIVADQRKLVQQAMTMIRSTHMEAFDLQHEPQNMRDAYGEGEFAAGCLLARRLVEQGVTFVEVSLRGWDTHQDNFSRTRQLAAQTDQPLAQLITDLKQRGMLDRTLVIWMGEFGRTPQINPRGGRDHYPKAFSGVLAGGGVQGGQIIGRTNPAGTEVIDRPIGVNDLFTTIYHTLGIDARHENTSRIGRPIKLVDGGEVVQELFS
jgi:hypothetical protein